MYKTQAHSPYASVFPLYLFAQQLALYAFAVCYFYVRVCDVRVYLLYGQNDVLKVWILMENNNNLLSFGLRCGDSVAFLFVVP